MRLRCRDVPPWRPRKRTVCCSSSVGFSAWGLPLRRTFLRLMEVVLRGVSLSARVKRTSTLLSNRIGNIRLERLLGDLRLERSACERTFGSIAVDSSKDRLVSTTRRWVESMVIAEKLCPFAPPLLQNDSLRIVSSQSTDETQAVEEVAAEANLLVGEGWDSQTNAQRPETTLLVIDAPFVRDFHDFVRLSWTLQSDAVLANGHADRLQLVLFHPLATHQTYSSFLEDSPGDYTIRAPFPTVHLLRQEDVTRAVASGYANLESLPARNQAKLISQGLNVCKSRLDRCYYEAHDTEWISR